MSSFYSNSHLKTSVQNSLDISNTNGFSIALFIQIAQEISTIEKSQEQQDDSSTYSLTPCSHSQSNKTIDSQKYEQTVLQNEEIEKSSDIDIQIEENQDNSSILETNDNENDEDDSNDYFAVKKSNIMKNILKSFQRFIESEKDQDKQKELCRLANKTYNYSQLKKLINRNLKAYGKRWNMKAKHMIEKSSFNMLLKHYLENINKLWLEKSKVQNKDEHLFVVSFMLQAIENPAYSQKIHFYQKKKCILK